MERWQQIEEIFQEALQHDPAERDAFVREACRGDTELQREVVSLLANHHEGTDFEPWAAAAAAQLIDRRVCAGLRGGRGLPGACGHDQHAGADQTGRCSNHWRDLNRAEG